MRRYRVTWYRQRPRYTEVILQRSAWRNTSHVLPFAVFAAQRALALQATHYVVEFR